MSKTSESELAEAISELTAQVLVLRNAVDELREEVQWSNHNAIERGLLRGRTIFSCSPDPTSPEFNVNDVDDETIEKLRSELPSISNCSSQQGELFS